MKLISLERYKGQVPEHVYEFFPEGIVPLETFKENRFSSFSNARFLHEV